jgi:hypothetical protein
MKHGHRHEHQTRYEHWHVNINNILKNYTIQCNYKCRCRVSIWHVSDTGTRLIRWVSMLRRLQVFSFFLFWMIFVYFVFDLMSWPSPIFGQFSCFVKAYFVIIYFGFVLMSWSSHFQHFSSWFHNLSLFVEKNVFERIGSCESPIVFLFYF